MAPEGMVHALTQIHRVLRPNGVLADIRPDRFPGSRHRVPQLPRVYWSSRGRERLVGVAGKTPENLRKHRAAGRAMARVTQRRLFVLERSETFSFRYHFRSWAVLERVLSNEWTATILPSSVRRRLQLAQRRSPNGNIVVVEPVCLNVLRKTRTGDGTKRHP
jgi:hypothetical protein